jgi:hypothetical protein
MAGAGAGAGNTEAQNTIIRYVLNPKNPAIKMDAFPWKTQSKRFENLYRGQSFTPKMKSSAAEEAKNALTIETTRGRPLSTSKELRDHIVKFAAGWDQTPPTGRVFNITLEPNVQFVDIRKEMQTMNLEPSAFEFLKPEIAAQAEKLEGEAKVNALKYAAQDTSAFRANFFINTSKENEVLVDLRNTEVMVSEFPAQETYPIYATRNKKDASGQEILVKKADGTSKKVRETYDTGKQAPVLVYATFVRPKESKGGRRLRGRTFRRKPMRRNKNGGRSTRKSKHGRNQ